MTKEENLQYWRNDPLLNEHHEHWHLVYPYEGVIDKNQNDPASLELFLEDPSTETVFKRWNSRHGELFAFMHQQLLARYNAERAANDLPDVEPYGDFSKSVKEAYEQHPELRSGGSLVRPLSRPTDYTPKDVEHPDFRDRPGARIIDQSNFLKRVKQWVENIETHRYPISLNELAEIIEPSDRRASEYTGAIHNDGHLLLSLYSNSGDTHGALFYEGIALTDAVFYRWHKYLDDIFQLLRESQPSHNAIPNFEGKITHLSVQPRGGQAELQTHLTTISLDTEMFGNSNHTFLHHSGFSYEVEISNEGDYDKLFCVRLFLCPEKSVDDHRAWIEIDKKILKVAKKSTSKRQFSSEDAHVVRKPTLTIEHLMGRNEWPKELGHEPDCKCGWPYTLLLPKGTESGEQYKFVAVLTDGSDLPGFNEESNSYCGTKDNHYPDVRPLGYPFDRPFAHNKFDNLLKKFQGQIVSSDMKIKHTEW